MSKIWIRRIAAAGICASIAVALLAIFALKAPELNAVLVESFSSDSNSIASFTMEVHDLDDDFILFHDKLTQCSQELLERVDTTHIGWARVSQRTHPFNSVRDLMNAAMKQNVAGYGTLFRLRVINSMWVLEMNGETPNEWVVLGRSARRNGLNVPLNVALYRVIRGNLQDVQFPKTSVEFAAEIERTCVEIEKVKSEVRKDFPFPVDVYVEDGMPPGIPAQAPSSKPQPAPAPVPDQQPAPPPAKDQ